MSVKKKIFISLTVILSVLILAATAWLSAYFFYRPDYLKSDKVFDIGSSPYGKEISVMSYNVRYLSAIDCAERSWFYRADLVTEIISSEKPDLIGFQEVTTEHKKYLTSHLKGYDFHIVYRDNSAAKEATVIAYRSDRFTLEDEGHFWLSETPSVMSKNWNSERFRDANYVVLTDKSTGKKFAFYNTHLDAKSAEARDKGMGVLLSEMKNTGSVPVILTGDMNDYENSPMYLRAINSGLKDSLKVALTADIGNGTTWNAYSDKPSQRIDFCFVSDGIDVLSFKINTSLIDGEYPSDHFPIITKIRL